MSRGASAEVGESGRAVNPLAMPESVRIAPRPSFVKGGGNLEQMGKRTALLKALKDRDGDRCFYCDVDFLAAHTTSVRHVDHVDPAALGGSDDFDNLVLACPSCNLRKGQLPGWFHMLRKQVVRLANGPSSIFAQIAGFWFADWPDSGLVFPEPPLAEHPHE